MKALICDEFGPEENLRVDEMPDPQPKKSEVLIDVKAAGLNFPDLLCVRGLYQMKPPTPFVPGTEGAGVVEAVGENVTHLKPGDRVLFNTMVGAFASKVAVPGVAAMKIPDIMSFEQAAGLTIVYGTSWHALKQRAALKAGETLLVLGAAGGVGLATVELGKAVGATVIAAASTAEKLETAKEHGADMVINYAEEDLKAKVKELTGGKGANVIYDPVGGDLSEQAFRAIAWEGRHLVIGFASVPKPQSLPMNLPLLKSADVRGVFWGTWTMKDPAGHMENMQELFTMYEEGKIKPHVAGTFGLDDYMDAFNTVSGRKAIGKVILTP